MQIISSELIVLKQQREVDFQRNSTGQVLSTNALIVISTKRGFILMIEMVLWRNKAYSFSSFLYLTNQ